MIKTTIHNLDHPTFLQLSELCYPPEDGYMGMYLELCWLAAYHYKKDDFLCNIYIEQSGENILGWCMVQDLLYRFNPYVEFGIFVAPKERRKGVASRLLEFALDDEENLRPLMAWIGNDTNRRFYERYKSRIACYDMKHYKLTEEYRRFKF